MEWTFLEWKYLKGKKCILGGRWKSVQTSVPWFIRMERAKTSDGYDLVIYITCIHIKYCMKNDRNVIRIPSNESNWICNILLDTSELWSTYIVCSDMTMDWISFNYRNGIFDSQNCLLTKWKHIRAHQFLELFSFHWIPCIRLCKYMRCEISEPFVYIIFSIFAMFDQKLLLKWYSNELHHCICE